jgi:poly(ADP-ribose) glycohydrolase
MADDLIEMPFQDISRWKEIKNNLIYLSKKLRNTSSNSKLIEETIMSYNTEFVNNWNFKNFHECLQNLENFIQNVLPKLIELVIQTTSLFNEPILILKQSRNCLAKLTQKQCACILANAFFCTFPQVKNVNLDSINFNRYVIIISKLKP